jgi:hypothetical protein
MNIITANQSIEPAVVQGAYARWFVSGHEERVEEEVVEQGAEVRYVAYVGGSYHAVYQLDLFTDPVVADSSEFQQLASRWRAERGTSSSTTEIVLCPSYQAIIGMGSKAVPLILAQMEAEGDHPDHWFWALRVLTKADPVEEDDQGDARKMAQAWLQWASRRYVW